MKYLASDLDGTLVHNDNEIREEDVQAILKFKERGYKFIIATGRSLSGIDLIFNKYPEIKYDYIVACNGAVIVDGNKNVIYDNSIKSDIAEKVFSDFIDEKEICVHFESEGNNYIIDPIHMKGIEEFMDYFKAIVPREKVFNQNRSYELISMFTRNKNIDIAESAKNRLAEKYGEDLEIFRNQFFIDIAPKDCSKGNAIMKILEIDGGQTGGLYTIGDSYNDLSMFAITQNSFTFTYAEDGVKQKAKNYVNSVKECIENVLI